MVIAANMFTSLRWFGNEGTALAGMNLREQEEVLLIYGPRKVRKAIRERRNAREQAPKKQSQS